MKTGILFSYVQCDYEVPKKLRENCVMCHLDPIFKNTLVSKNNIGDLMTNAEEQGEMSQTRKTLISSFTLQNGTLIFPRLLFYLKPRFVVTKKHRFAEYAPKKVLTTLYSQQWTQKEKVTRMKTPV